MKQCCELLAIFLICCGCGGQSGPELGEVSGTITLDGKPLTSVNIQFTPEGGSPSFGGTNADGVYKLLYSQDASGAMIGTHNVSITLRELPTDENGNPTSADKPVEIPAKYLAPGALTAEVKAGTNTVDFALTSD